MNIERVWKNNLGPRKAKPILALLKQLDREADMCDELHGVVGGDCTKSTVSVFNIGGTKEPENPKAVELMQILGERYQFDITPGNYKALESDLLIAVVQAQSARKTKDNRRTPEQEAETKRFLDEQREKSDKANAEWAACYLELERKKPHGAMALIVATEDIDDSEMQSDYFNHKTGRVVAIGWRTGAREDFKQLRQAAATFKETQHLGPGCEVFRVVDEDSLRYLTEEKFATKLAAEEWIAVSLAPEVAGVEIIEDESIEHREKWSMGSGNYLKAGSTHSSGWRVKSIEWASVRTYYHKAIEIQIPEREQSPGGPTGSDPNSPSGNISVSHNAAQNGVEIRFQSKPEDSVLNNLKAHGFRWSRFSKCWYKRWTPEAQTFANNLAGIREGFDQAQDIFRKSGDMDAVLDAHL